jgi:lipopolysaccharide transport system permease protein
MSEFPPQQAAAPATPVPIPAPLPAAPGAFAAGWRECATGLANWRIAHLEGTAVLRRRYARSRLGQFWITLSTGASIAAMGAVWTLLWKQPAAEIFPYIALSLVFWNFLSGVVNEGASVFVSHAHTLANQGTAVSTYVYALLYRAVLVLAHDALIIVVVLALYPGGINTHALLFLPAFALTLVSGFCVAYLAGMLCTRYRDMILLTATTIQLLFYITPVLWKRDFLPAQFGWIAHYNPFALYLGLLRDPLLGHAVAGRAWAGALALTAALLLATLYVAGRVRRRLIYWL